MAQIKNPAASLPLKKRKERASLKKQLRQAVKYTLRADKFLSVYTGMYGQTYLLYVFGPGITRDEKNEAIEEITRIIMQHEGRLDLLSLDETSEYPELGGEKFISLYAPERIRDYLSHAVEPGERGGVHVSNIAKQWGKETTIASLDQLHRYDVIRVTPLGHVWWKEGLDDLVREDPDLAYPPTYVEPRLIR